MSDENYTFAIAVNNMETLRKNLYLSPGLLGDHKHQMLIKENYPSASLAYNSAIDEAEHEIIIFIHQDIYLPETWFSDISRCLSYLEERQINWGVLGCFGSGKAAGAGLGRVYTTGLGLHGRKINKPEPVETLDEIILIIRKSSGLKFDPCLPHFHLYGTDLCMSAKDKGMTNFAFQGLCVHNTNQLLSLPKEFYDCYPYVKRKWAKFLPIYTSCLTISYFDKELYMKRFSEYIEIMSGKRRVPLFRIDDPRAVLREEL
ncbi:MAG: glycosyltransferase [Methylobacter sp.]|uniref:Glycosyltransferase n=1 Tax=Candidatus Methylobacter titanis TaxID=3053457 RepID=A0AA43Q7Z1_9GAMM|nr:glycosyltransferase [Candidatus Methylobacter titanis]